MPADPRLTLPLRASPLRACVAMPRLVKPSRNPPCLPDPAIPCLYEPRLPCLSVLGLSEPCRALPAMLCRASRSHASPISAPPAVPSLPRATMSGLSMPVLPCLNEPRRASPILACLAVPVLAQTIRAARCPACLAGPGHTVPVRAPPRLRRLVDTKLRFNCFLSVALHYLEQAEPTACTSFAVRSARSNPHL